MATLKKKKVISISAPKKPNLSLPLPDQTQIRDLIYVLTQPSPEDSILVSLRGEEEKKPLDEDADLRKAFQLLKGLVFKADRPYRCRQSFMSSWGTTAAGVVNQTVAVNNIINSVAWSSITTLFDEFFVHSMTFHHFPHNGAGAFPVDTSVAGATVGVPTVAGSNTVIYNCALVIAPLYGNYTASAAVGLINVPGRALRRTDKGWTYTWRNNVRFDPHGITLSPGATARGWTGWTASSDASYIGGSIVMRAVNDQAIGDLTHAVNLGLTVCDWDVSVRAKA